MESQPTATVVIVSSDATERERLVSVARMAGHTVIESASAEQALSRIAPPARMVLIIDHVLHDMSAHELIEALHQRGLFVPTLVVVPNQAIGQAVVGLRSGAKDVLEQPFGEKRLLTAIAQALDKP